MRILVIPALIGLSLLASCSSMRGATGSSYQADMDALEAACTQRQGILTPTGLQTGRPETEYACRITGGATRIPQS